MFPETTPHVQIQPVLDYNLNLMEKFQILELTEFFKKSGLIQFRFKVIEENDLGDFGISDRLLVIVRFPYRFDCMISVLPIAARNSGDEDKIDVIIQTVYKNKINYFHLIHVTRTRKFGQTKMTICRQWCFATTLCQINRANLAFVERPH